MLWRLTVTLAGQDLRKLHRCTKTMLLRDICGGMVEGRAPADRAEDYVGAGFTGVTGHKPPGFL